MFRIALPAFAAFALLAASPAPASDWSAFVAPSAGPAQAIGSYANGCIAGAAELPLEGPGWQVNEPQRRRNYGHPQTVAVVADLARFAATEGLGRLLVGDLSQPRGGRMSYGHSSHRTGLDADIWFRLDLPELPRAARRDLDLPSLVDAGTGRAHPTDAQLRLLRRAAEDPRVARIFVNPAIKLALCERAGPDRDWLRAVRPWSGHDRHFHVRLHCPADSPGCAPQAAPPPGDGCGAELMDWFKPKPATRPKTTVKVAPAPPPPEPAACLPV